MTLSVVIPTFKRTESLRICLEGLSSEKQGVSSMEYEVVVSDDSDEDHTKNLIKDRFPWVKWVRGPGRGPAANRNFGAASAKGNWIVFTDDDCIPKKGWLAVYKENILRLSDRYDVFEGRTLSDRPQRRYDEESPLNTTGGHLWSCNFAIDRKLFERVGGFDEGFPFAAMEDVDLFFRVSKLSKCLFLPEAIVIHPWRIIIPNDWLIRQYRSRVYFLKKHKDELGYGYRFAMVKSFFVTLIQGGGKLVSFSFRGWRVYLAHCVLRCKMIFA